MSFTVLRVEVQQWEDEEILLPVGGHSEEGVETDDVVEETGHQDYNSHSGMRVVEPAMLFIFFPRAEVSRILSTLKISWRGMIATAWRRFTVEFDRQVDIGHHVGSREENVQDEDRQDGGQPHLCVLSLIMVSWTASHSRLGNLRVDN